MELGRRGAVVIASFGYFGRVAEWQTRWLQVPVSFGTWGFKSPFAHRRLERVMSFLLSSWWQSRSIGAAGAHSVHEGRRDIRQWRRRAIDVLAPLVRRQGEELAQPRLCLRIRGQPV